MTMGSWRRSRWIVAFFLACVHVFGLVRGIETRARSGVVDEKAEATRVQLHDGKQRSSVRLPVPPPGGRDGEEVSEEDEVREVARLGEDIDSDAEVAAREAEDNAQAADMGIPGDVASAEVAEEAEEDEDYSAYGMENEPNDTEQVRMLKEQLKILQEEHARDTKLQKELVKRLRDIQSELTSFRSAVRDPKLSEWMLKRTEDLGTFLGSKRVGQALESNLKKLLRRTQKLEQTLDKDLTQVVGTKYSEPLARFVTMLLVALPVSIVVYGIYRSSVVFSVRQYVLVGHLSNLIFVMSSLVLYGILRRDPFTALIEAQHEVGVILTQVWLALQYFSMLLLLLFALLASKTRFQRSCFLAQIGLMLLVGLDYRRRVYLSVLNSTGPSNSGVAGFVAYFVYTVVAIVLIVITVKTAKISRNETLVHEVDAVLTLFSCGSESNVVVENEDAVAAAESGSKEV